MGGSLFERLGGKDAITAVVDDFVARCAGDDRINGKFARTDIARLKANLVDQVCEATGGPCTYTGRSMKAAHAQLNINDEQWQAMLADFRTTLNKFTVPAKEQGELIAIVQSTRPDIVIAR